MSRWSGPSLPTGTLTFLFTDVEGSTRLWEEQPQAMRQVLARHDTLLTQLVEQNEGVVVRPRGEGDSLFCVFVRASDAVAAALAGQRALLAEDWGEVGPLRVRMGLHTGEADLREGDYYGAAVNRCARIRAAGHGGQVLLSQTTADLVRSSLPAGASLQALGAHALRDLSQPEPLYQLDTPDRPTAFPPLATVSAQPTNLPSQLTSFNGREPELADLMTLVQEQRLVTLTGPGGSGKTRLALQVAAQLLEDFGDGVWFVDLAGVADPAGVIPAIAQVFGVVESEGRTLAVSLAAYVRRKQLLLVVDNFEQVVDAALVLHDLLVEAPRLVLLVTSRARLRVDGEHEYPVAPLPLPAAPHYAAVALSGAAELFVQRTRAVQPGFTLTSENAATVGELCRRVDGLPLAIELAAARVKLLPPVTMLARLDRALPLLTGGARSRPARQQTLRATLQWSWTLLSGEEQVLFRRLGVFAGSFSLDAAEAVCNPDGDLDVLAGLGALVDQSLVQQRERDGAPRFSLLVTVREFALEQLVASGEADALHRRHATFYCTLAEHADAATWRSGRVEQDLLRPLDPERDNLLASLGWALARQETDLGLRLGGGLGFWFFCRASGEGLRWLRQVLGLPWTAEHRRPRGLALYGAACCAVPHGETTVTAAYLAESAACLRAAEELPRLSITLAMLSNVIPAAETGRAVQLAEDALALARLADAPHVLAYAELCAGITALYLTGDRTVARRHWEEARRLARLSEADWLTLTALTYLAQLLQRQGEHVEAQRLWWEARPLAERLGERVFAGFAYIYPALVASTAGAWGQAAADWRRALALARELESTPLVVSCLAGIAGMLAARGEPELGARLLGASNNGWRHEAAYGVYLQTFQDAYEPARVRVQTALSDEDLARAWAEGEALSLDQAADLALAALAELDGS